MSNAITYSAAYKRALPNYENTTAFFSISREVGEGQTEDEVKNELVAKVDGWMEQRINEIDAEVAALR